MQDIDHLLSFFIFDESAFAAFVRNVPPLTDDRTVLDFTMPRYLGSGFGLGTWNGKVVANGLFTPLSVALARARYYTEHRRSVVPLLRDLGGEPADAIAARIKLAIPYQAVAEEEWLR